jgi:hypothetical protein
MARSCGNCRDNIPRLLRGSLDPRMPIGAKVLQPHHCRRCFPGPLHPDRTLGTSGLSVSRSDDHRFDVDRIRVRRTSLAATAYTALLEVAVSVAANLRSTTTPFKRNSVVQYREVVDFVRSNDHGKTAVLTMDASPAILFRLFRNGAWPSMRSIATAD